MEAEAAMELDGVRAVFNGVLRWMYGKGMINNASERTIRDDIEYQEQPPVTKEDRNDIPDLDKKAMLSIYIA